MLENKLGLTSSADLVREEERISKKKAVELFEQGNTSIMDVSLSVGFHNLSYFHRAFKKKYHMTPHTFIKQLRGIAQ